MALTESQNQQCAAPNSLAGVTAELRRWFADTSDHSLAQKIAGGAFLIRVASAVVVYASQVLLARWMGSFEFGIYVYAWTWVLLIGDLADLGLGSAAQRFIPEYAKREADALLRGFLSRSRWLAVTAATGVAVCSAIVVALLEPWLDSYVVLPLGVACVTLPFYALMQIQDGIARSNNWIRLALMPPYVVRHLVMLALVLTAYLLAFPATAVTAIGAVGIAFALTVVGQTIVLNRKLARTVAPGPKAYETRKWIVVSVPILLVETFYALLANTDILVLQQFRPPDDVAVYYAATKTLALIAFVHFAVSAAVAHRFTEYHVAADRERLATFLASSIRWTFWSSLAATVVVLLAGQLLLSLFGNGFADGYPLMFILAAGLLARATVGPAQRLLSMVGEQKVCALIYATAFALNLVLCVALIPRYGAVGAAAATSVAIVLESILLFWVTRVRLGLHGFIRGGSTAR